MMKIWSCKIGEVSEELLPHGADFPMREAVEKAYEEITGQPAAFVFSGWGGSLTEGERACVENRLPDFDLVASEDPETLLAEVTALRAELAAARASWAEASDVAIDGLLRAEERRRALAEREADAARAERTEPATGEDVEVVARLLYAEDAGDNWEEMAEHLEDADPETQQAYRNAAGRILAALDLPGREQALREAEAQRDKWMESHHQLGKRYESTLEAAKVAIAERNEAREAAFRVRHCAKVVAERDDALQRLANVNQEASAS